MPFCRSRHIHLGGSGHLRRLRTEIPVTLAFTRRIVRHMSCSTIGRGTNVIRRVLLFSLMASVAAMTMSCGDKDSSPNPVGPSNPSATPPVTPPFPLLLVNCWEDYGPGYRCRAEYVTSYVEQGRDVTGFSTWSTSDSSIATVDTTGYVTVARAGNVAIRAVYRDFEGYTPLNAQVRGPTR